MQPPHAGDPATGGPTEGTVPVVRRHVGVTGWGWADGLPASGRYGGPDSPYYGNNLLAYNSSKSALNGLTLAFAKDLAGERISVNSVCPGWVKTDMGTDAAPRTVEQGAAIAVKLATMDDPPTARFLDDGGEIPW